MTRRPAPLQSGPSQTESAQVDAHVGSRIRLRRMLLGITQQELAKSLSTTYQQIGLYERGVNRVPASKLYAFSQVLAVPVEFFFEGFSKSTKSPPEETFSGPSEPQASLGDVQVRQKDGRTQREVLEFLRAYGRLADPSDRKRVLDLLRRLDPGRS